MANEVPQGTIHRIPIPENRPRDAFLDEVEQIAPPASSHPMERVEDLLEEGPNLEHLLLDVRLTSFEDTELEDRLDPGERLA